MVVIYAPHPPFGTACLSFGGLASILFNYGFYSSASFVSQDSALRRLIRDIALTESSKLIGDMGRAEMVNELIKRIFLISKEGNLFFNKQTDFQNHIAEENIKQYLNELFKELDRSEKVSKNKLK